MAAANPSTAETGFGIEGGPEWRGGTLDPSVAEIVAPVSAQYWRNNSDVSEVWEKTGTGNGDWTLVSSGGAPVNPEDVLQNLYSGKTGVGSELPDYSSENVVTDNDTLVVAIGKLDTERGVDVVPIVRTNNPTVGANVLNGNMSALDAAIGPSSDLGSLYHTSANNNIMQNISGVDQDLGPLIGDARSRTNFPIVNNDPANDNIRKLDKAVGQDTDISSSNYIAVGNTLSKNLSNLDSQLATLASGVKWYVPSPFCITDDAGLRAAADATTLASLLPFSDDAAPVLVEADFNFGDYIFSRDNPGIGKMFEVYDSGGAVKAVRVAGVTQLETGDTFFVRHDLLQTLPTDEQVNAYRYNGTDVLIFARISVENADTIATTSAYAAASGDPAAGDTIETILEYLDGNIDNVNTAMGIIQSATDMGAYTGTIIPDSETTKQNIQSLETEIEKISGIVNDTLVPATPKAVDTIVLTGTQRYQWDIVIYETATPENAYAAILTVLANAGGTFDPSKDNVDVIGALATPTIAASVAGGNLILTITAAVACTVRLRRKQIL